MEKERTFVNPMKRKTSKQTNKNPEPQDSLGFSPEVVWMVRVGRRFQGKDGSLPGVRKERLEFRKPGVMKRPWVPERRK